MELRAGVRSASVALTLVILLVLPLAQGTNNNTRKCGLWIHTPGYTLPQGDIVIREGNPLEILCVLSEPWYQDRYHNSTDLRVYNNETLVDPEYLSIVNETTLRYYVSRAPPMKAMFYCKLKVRQSSKEIPVCLNTVNVGYEPLGVENFSCISYNWQSLNCSWVPKYNPVPTTYRIFFQLRSHESSAYKCPNNSDERLNTCVWNDASDPTYRQSYPVYKFTLAGENALKNKTFSFEMDHFKHILPAPPTNFEVVNVTSSSFFLKWTIPFPMNSWARSYRLFHKIAYAYKGAKELSEKADPFIIAFQDSRNSSSDHSPNCSFDDSQDYVCYYNLTGLQYAYYLYDIRVFIKTENASDAFWSPPVFQVKKTAPSIPPKPPSTDVGSFEVAYNKVTLNLEVARRDVTVYWQSLPENLYSGANFSYKIVEVLQNNKRTTSVKTDAIGKKSVVLRNLTVEDTYIVRIASSNEIGDSLETSVVTIPAYNYNKPLPEPEAFTKTSLRNGDFKLTWSSPRKFAYQVRNYTIFWCDSDNDRPETCSGFLNWTHVDRDVRELTVRLKPMMYHFAIAANSERGSSGMVWASCSMIADKVDKLKTVHVGAPEATSVDVEWKLHCTDANNVVKGFIIFYCVAHSGENQDCKEKEQNVTIDGAHTLKKTLSGLQPYVTYRISVAIKTEVGWSVPSDPIFKTLKEAAPSTPPTDVRVVAVTNSSIKVSWIPPSKLNGVLKFYEVNCSGIISKHKINSSAPTEVTIENLRSYTNYSIQVKACTVACSDASPPVAAETLVGVPGVILDPHLEYLNRSQVLLTWTPPEIRGGRIDYYSISVNIVRTNILTQNNTYEYNVTGTSYQIPIPDCKIVSDVSITFTIRAVNLDGDKVFLGKAVTVPNGTCYTDERLLYVILCSIGGVVISLLVIGFAVYYSRMLHKSCREMRDLTVKLPKGMIPEDDTKDQGFGLPKPPWIPHDDNDDSSGKTRQAADEQKLLDRNAENSVRSSGIDTASTSTASGTHMSTSSRDSGAEVDQKEQGFAESSKWAGGKSAVEKKSKPEPEWGQPYVHVGSPATGVGSPTAPLYPNVEASNWLPPCAIGGYVTMTGKEGTFAPQMQQDVSPVTPQTKPTRGYVAHNAPVPNGSAAVLWSKPVFSEGYVQTGVKNEDVVEDEVKEDDVGFGSEEAEPIVASKCALNASIVSPSGVLRGDDYDRTSVEMPLVSTRTLNGYVAHPFVQATPTPVAQHEYVRTAGKNPPSLKLDNSKSYTRVGDALSPVARPTATMSPALTPTPASTPVLTPALTPTPVLTATSGYVPHRQFENRCAPGVHE